MSAAIHAPAAREPAAKIESFKVRAVNAPLAMPLVTASGILSSAPLVLLDIQFAGGLIGRSYIFTYTSYALKASAQLISDMFALVDGMALSPIDISNTLDRAMRLIGPQGLNGTAAAAIDMAAWDALARANDAPLAELLGSAVKPVPAYYSAPMLTASEAIAQTETALTQGFRAFKIKIGHPDAAQDIEVIKAIRKAGGPELSIMADFNQSLSVPEAITRILRIEEHDQLAWVEEPVLHHDFAGHAAVRAKVSTPVQLGENWWGIADMAKSIAAGAGDLCMPDMMKIGGVTGMLRAAGLAEAHGLPMSAHIFQEMSAHVLCATPGAHWLEYFNFADPVQRTPIQIVDGNAMPSTAPGGGLEWDEAAIARYAV